MLLYQKTGTKELANDVTATTKTAGNKACLRPNLSDSLPMINAPGIQPINSIDCDKLAKYSFPQMRFHCKTIRVFKVDKHRSSGKKLIKYRANSSYVIMSVILMTTLFYKAFILQGEI